MDIISVYILVIKIASKSKSAILIIIKKKIMMSDNNSIAFYKFLKYLLFTQDDLGRLNFQTIFHSDINATFLQLLSLK